VALSAGPNFAGAIFLHRDTPPQAGIEQDDMNDGVEKGKGETDVAHIVTDLPSTVCPQR